MRTALVLLILLYWASPAAGQISGGGSGGVGTADVDQIMYNNASAVDGITGSVVDGSGNVTFLTVSADSFTSFNDPGSNAITLFGNTTFSDTVSTGKTALYLSDALDDDTFCYTLDDNSTVHCLAKDGGNVEVGANDTLTINEMYGGLHIATASNLTFTLPTAVSDPPMHKCFVNRSTSSGSLSIRPAAGDAFYLHGKLAILTNAESILSSTAHSSACIRADSAGNWIVVSQLGTWTEESP